MDTDDGTGLPALSQRECLTLMMSVPIGRIVFTDRALPAIQPVSFTVDDDSVVIRTAYGSKLAAATSDAVVAFETDQIDPVTRSGWSVTVVGHAQLVYDPGEIQHLADLPLHPWVGGQPVQFIRIRLECITGRRIRLRGPAGSTNSTNSTNSPQPDSAQPTAAAMTQDPEIRGVDSTVGYDRHL